MSRIELVRMSEREGRCFFMPTNKPAQKIIIKETGEPLACIGDEWSRVDMLGIPANCTLEIYFK